MTESNRLPVYTCHEVRAIDRAAVDLLGVPPLLLMENAGRSLVECWASFLNEANFSKEQKDPFTGKRVLILCGKGNNGGDGFVMARHLLMHDAFVHVLAIAPAEQYTGEAAVNLRILENMLLSESCSFEPFAKNKKLSIQYFQGNASDTINWSEYDWIVDAMLGTGATGPLRPPYDELVHAVNRSDKPVFAVDIPSGLDADSGDTFEPDAIRAAATCTLAALKPGLILPKAAPFVGRLYCGLIGVSILGNE